ncbi:MAG TPA: 16S rRNA (guanine(966)-N(2))-methyltransferase RsmD [Gemmatimonadales bacterium]
MTVRIVGGALGGRAIQTPADDRVRPTTDRVREALFNVLAAEVPDSTVLDLFAGSGALGLEALSRGAARVTFVDIGPRSLAALRGNIAALGLDDRATVRRADALRFVRQLAGDAFDIAVADPPYSTNQPGELARLFRERPFARILVVEHSSRLELAGGDTRRYGNVALTFYHAP